LYSTYSPRIFHELAGRDIGRRVEPELLLGPDAPVGGGCRDRGVRDRGRGLDSRPVLCA